MGSRWFCGGKGWSQPLVGGLTHVPKASQDVSRDDLEGLPEAAPGMSPCELGTPSSGGGKVGGRERN